MKKEGKQSIKIPSEKSVVVFCIVVLVIVLCGILGYKN
jgi:flagellar assembly factor FliW